MYLLYLMLMENVITDIKKGGGEVYDKLHIFCCTHRDNPKERRKGKQVKRKQVRSFLKPSV